ncbi:uncharacterized protein LOC132697295 isoform X2 [Cylas formicarius]|nr:uncharacterized protein LOC132697295 isoform X2 [Cylas formicarius]XP_060518650.1 uncharacterized protein LOC132697295 isoform X2 [Cylas formicarius]
MDIFVEKSLDETASFNLALKKLMKMMIGDTLASSSKQKPTQEESRSFIKKWLPNNFCHNYIVSNPSTSRTHECRRRLGCDSPAIKFCVHDYKSDTKKTDRNVAMELLIEKCREYYPDAGADFAKRKLDTLRGCFRKEYKKVADSRKIATSLEEVYKPSLWYYNLLLFTVGESPDESLEPLREFNRFSYWNREYTLILIELFKKYPVLYLHEAENNKGKRVTAFKDLTEELTRATGKKFSFLEVRKKVRLLRDQYRRERRKLKLGLIRQSTLWCYDLLKFLKNNTLKINEETKGLIGSESDYEKDSENETDNFSDLESSKISCAAGIKTETELNNTVEEIGRDVAHKLRDMSDMQRKYAESLINEVMYQGMMQNLSSETKLFI